MRTDDERGAGRPAYRARLGAVTAAAAIPQGYTLTTWASGALVAHAAGLPDLWRALAFLVCAALAFAAVAMTAGPPAPSPTPGAPASPLPQLLSAVTAVVVVAVIVALVHDAPVWPLAGIGATATYFLAIPGWAGLLGRP